MEIDVVGRAGFEPATARCLWPVQARMKPTVGRPLQRLRPLGCQRTRELCQAELPPDKNHRTKLKDLCVLEPR
jgi:hypothetical protein